MQRLLTIMMLGAALVLSGCASKVDYGDAQGREIVPQGLHLRPPEADLGGGVAVLPPLAGTHHHDPQGSPLGASPQKGRLVVDAEVGSEPDDSSSHAFSLLDLDPDGWSCNTCS